jgi:hypothetical protein
MSVLRTAPFDLAKGTKIIARGKASNIKGFNSQWSDTDPANFNVVVETEPDAVGQPVEGADSTFNVLHAYWAAIPNYGTASGGVTAAI